MERNINKQNAAEMGRLGGIKSGESRRMKAELKDIARTIMSMPIKKGEIEDFDCIMDAKDKNLTPTHEIFLVMYSKARKGDKQAAEFCFKYAGLEPDNNININAEVTETNNELNNILGQLTEYKKTSKYFKKEDE